jgi:LacI family transcriptional regulator
MSKTIKDVAKYAGLSVATISKYLNGGNVRKENKLLIEEAINKLNYNVNEIARGLKIRRTMTIGILLSRFEWFFTSIISIIEHILMQAGYSTIICDCQENVELEKEKLNFLVRKRVDGIIILPTGEIAEELKTIIVKGIPVILLDQILPGVACDAVVGDNVNAAYNAVKHLITKGHKRIGIICGPEQHFSAIERLKGYHRVHEDYHLLLDPELIKFGDYKVESGYRLFKELMTMNTPPTAIFVTNYDMTIGSLMAVNEMGIKIPQKLSLFGFDDILLFKILKPSLSIVIQPIQKIGEEAVRILLKRLKGDRSNFPEIARLETQLFLGESVGEVITS